jgi:phosphatidylserine/phosphatidylglycerophosphate/cardiolipin synthase-like enzyme
MLAGMLCGFAGQAVVDAQTGNDLQAKLVIPVEAATGLPLGTYYSPETNLEPFDVNAIKSAVKSIDLAAFSLTDQAMIDVLKAQAGHGVVIRIYLDRGELQAECRGDISCQRSPIHELMDVPGVTIKVKYSKVLMHLKSYLVDDCLLRDGSANFSVQGESRQDNSAVFSTDAGAMKGFGTKFAEMWMRPDNLGVAQAVTEAKK